jgi:hypothetical protein
MASAKLHNGIELCYEVIEPKESPPKVRVPLLLIQGLGGQLISWDDDFCDELADRGWTVVRFDNRDVGLSTKLEGAGLPRLGDVLAGDYSSVAYGLADMAEDAAGLIEALGFPCAHVVGISMGGMTGSHDTWPRSSPSRTGPRRSGDSGCPRWSSTAMRTPWSPCLAARPPHAPFQGLSSW